MAAPEELALHHLQFSALTVALIDPPPESHQTLIAQLAEGADQGFVLLAHLQCTPGVSADDLLMETAHQLEAGAPDGPRARQLIARHLDGRIKGGLTAVLAVEQAQFLEPAELARLLEAAAALRQRNGGFNLLLTGDETLAQSLDRLQGQLPSYVLRGRGPTAVTPGPGAVPSQPEPPQGTATARPEPPPAESDKPARNRRSGTRQWLVMGGIFAAALAISGGVVFYLNPASETGEPPRVPAEDDDRGIETAEPPASTSVPEEPEDWPLPDTALPGVEQTPDRTALPAAPRTVEPAPEPVVNDEPADAAPAETPEAATSESTSDTQASRKEAPATQPEAETRSPSAGSEAETAATATDNAEPPTAEKETADTVAQAPAQPAPETPEPAAAEPTTPQASVEPEKAQAPAEKDWFAQQPDDYYTVQLIALYSTEEMERFLADNDLEGWQLARHTQQRNGRTMHVLTLGAYPEVGDAKAAIRELPADIRELGPWIRSVGSLRPDNGR